jgi:hypothetical protein
MANGGRTRAPVRPDGRRLGLGILGRALRWRRLSGGTLLAVAVIAIAASAIGPAFLRAADQSSFTSAVADAAPGSTDVSVITNGGAGALDRLDRASADLRQLGGGRWFGAPVTTVDVGMSYHQPEQKQTYILDLLAATSICSHVRLVSGACPRGAGDAALSARSAALAGLHLGQTLTVAVRHGDGTLRLHLTGLYDPPRDVDNDYWDDNDVFAQGTGRGLDPLFLPLDPLLVQASTALQTVPLGAVPALSTDLFLRAGSLRTGRFGSFESDLRSTFVLLGQRYSLTADTQLFASWRRRGTPIRSQPRSSRPSPCSSYCWRSWFSIR